MPTRREFVLASAALAAGSLIPSTLARGAYAGGRGTIRVGVIGCGGRGRGAAVNILEASPDTEIVALADVFAERVEQARQGLADIDPALAARARVEPERCFVGFDAYERLLRTDCDLVILATPPHFRPAHLAAAVAAGKHVFMEKPVAVDPAGVRSVLASADVADQKRLCIVAGTQRRHEQCYLEVIQRLRDGALGGVVGGRVYWNQGGLWMHERRPGWTDMEWQLRNWLYFTWLSGDHIVEQHVHNLDVANWVVGSHPVRCLGMGGRQVRVSPDYGHIFDHFAVEYEYPNGVIVTSQCRQIDGCASRVEERFRFERGDVRLTSGLARLSGAVSWSAPREQPNPYVQEHRDLIAAITGGQTLNEARQIAESTLTAIMGRMSAYTGQEVTWEQAMNSTLDLTPAKYEFGPMPMPEVPVPGKTKLV